MARLTGTRLVLTKPLARDIFNLLHVYTMLGPATKLRRSVELTIWQLVRLAIFDNELWTDYATIVCSHACDILSLNCVLVILFCSSAVCRCLLFVSLFRNTRFIS